MTDRSEQAVISINPVSTGSGNSLMTSFSLVRRGFELTGQTLKLMIGVGDYDAYVNHMREHHADAPVMDYKHWYRNRVDARYGAGKDGAMKRCPC